MSRIALLHTAEAHVATFTRLIADLTDTVDLHHVTRPDLLQRAQSQGLAAVQADVQAALSALAPYDAVLCTCSTLGPLVDAFATPHVIRIDRPAMEQALIFGPDIAVAICLESTRAATLALLAETAAAMGVPAIPRTVLCDAAWPFFLTGQTDRFAASIADQIGSELAGYTADCILLAQASMQVAAPLLADLGCPVLTTPGLAALKVIDVARQNASIPR